MASNPNSPGSFGTPGTSKEVGPRRFVHSIFKHKTTDHTQSIPRYETRSSIDEGSQLVSDDDLDFPNDNILLTHEDDSQSTNDVTSLQRREPSLPPSEDFSRALRGMKAALNNGESERQNSPSSPAISDGSTPPHGQKRKASEDEEEEPQATPAPKRHRVHESLSDRTDTARKNQLVQLPTKEADLDEVVLLPLSSSTDEKTKTTAKGHGLARYFSWLRTSTDEVVELNPNWDLMIVLHVCKDAASPEQAETKKVGIMCARSSVSAVASSKQWRETFGNDWEVHVQDADEFAFLFILKVAHDRDLRSYEELDDDQVIELAGLVHKYDASPRVRREVISRIPEKWKSSGPGVQEYLFVSWTFGFVESFVSHYRGLVRNLHVDTNGEACDDDLVPLQGYFPTAVLQQILRTRADLLKKLLDLTYDYVDKMLDPNSQICAVPNQHSQQLCIAEMLGTFICGLAKLGLPMAKPNVEDVTSSVTSLEYYLKNIKGHRSTRRDRHDESPSPRQELLPNCQKKSLWHFFVDRELVGLDDVPEKLRSYVQDQKAKAVQV